MLRDEVPILLSSSFVVSKREWPVLASLRIGADERPAKGIPIRCSPHKCHDARKVLTGIPNMEPSQPVECDSKRLDVQFAFE